MDFCNNHHSGIRRLIKVEFERKFVRQFEDIAAQQISMPAATIAKDFELDYHRSFRMNMDHHLEEMDEFFSFGE